MVVLSAFFQSALVFGVLRSFGVFFVEFVAAFEEQAARVSWIASIGIAVQQFGSECCVRVRWPATLGEKREFGDQKGERKGRENAEGGWRRPPRRTHSNSPGPIGSALSTKLGPRPVVMTGGILAALGMLLASFATSLTHLYLSIGLLSGETLGKGTSPRPGMEASGFSPSSTSFQKGVGRTYALKGILTLSD